MIPLAANLDEQFRLPRALVAFFSNDHIIEHEFSRKGFIYLIWFFSRYFVKQLCRQYGTDIYKTLVAVNEVTYLQWTILPELREGMVGYSVILLLLILT